MPYIVVEDFKLGQDDRRADVTAPPGTLRRLKNAHINRGGEIEKRKAFVAKHALPANTLGMAAYGGTLYVFGSATAPTLPSGVSYQRLQHPSGQALAEVLSTDNFNGKLYVVGRFADGSLHHFYDGTRVSAWFDGKARGGFDVTGGAVGVAATTSFRVTGGTSLAGVNAVTSITVGGTEVLGSGVDWATSNSATATAIAAQISSYTSSPEYTASAVGDTVTITASTVSSSENGKVVSVVVGGDVTTTTPAAMSGGVTNGSVTSIKVNGVEVLGTPVSWATSNSATATAIAAQITSYTSSPEYTGAAISATVNVVAGSAGTAPNGYAVAVTTAGSITVGSVRAFSGGEETTGTFEPGASALTFRQKVYSTSGGFLHFSKLGDPTAWQTSDTGAGFVNMASQASGSEELTAVATYYSYLAVFAKRAVQIWKMDADPELNAQVQVLRNTGTYAARSVGAFGDGDVIYLTRSGIRALRARDSSNAGTQAEIGAPIDRTVIDYAASLTQTVREQAVAVVEPIDNRYLLAMGNKVFAYSLFSGSRISAWSEYDLSYQITDFAIVDDRLYARAGDTIYLYGGDDNATYDNSEVVIELPFLDGKSPATTKRFTGIDAAVDGQWLVELSTNPEKPGDFVELCRIWGPTYARSKLGGSARSTHFKLRFTHSRAEYARLSSVSVHYEGGAAG